MVWREVTYNDFAYFLQVSIHVRRARGSNKFSSVTQLSKRGAADRHTRAHGSVTCPHLNLFLCRQRLPHTHPPGVARLCHILVNTQVAALHDMISFQTVSDEKGARFPILPKSCFESGSFTQVLIGRGIHICSSHLVGPSTILGDIGGARLHPAGCLPAEQLATGSTAC